ncbi:alpha/beta fold hydrolase [Methanobacterium alcaliphilum]|uniref:alpha/beta fold hydrolase n=1 Tax=Methanobacterium alcaliphilum TaxID=392018 RepID=UPI00200AAAE5|nr:alpha/beta fold hydrolase [Methanobacterium alcaliphilum]MCK9150605.1 alpha/beta hydrolase [Methanobacterium alcaliphilum]
MVLNSTNSYNVTDNDDFITFTPHTNKSTTGIIFYPGAKVQAESYSIIASTLAKNGYMVVIVKMPFNLAFFGVNKADEVMTQHEEIKSWVMMGHSLGGVFASEYALSHQNVVKGVVYLAAYPSSNASNATFNGLSIRGSLDALTTSQDILNNKDKFPTNTTFITINGGNHYNFGDYGVQEGDNNSTITRQGQQNLTVDYILEFIQNL